MQTLPGTHLKPWRSGRRSSRLAKPSNSAAAEQAPALAPLNSNTTSLQPAHSRTIASKQTATLSEEMIPPLPTLADFDNTIHSHKTNLNMANKENVVPSCYDRIKSNPRNATKRISSYNPQTKGSSESKQRAPRQTMSSRTASETDIAPLHVQAQRAVMECVASSRLPLASDGSDVIYQGTVLRNQQLSETQDSSSSSTLDASVQSPPPSRTVKRQADPECDSEPSPKRSRSFAGQLEQSIEQPEQTTVDSRTYPLGAAPETPLLEGGESSVVPKPIQVATFGASFSSDTPDPSLQPPHFGSTDADTIFMPKVRASLLTQTKRKTANVGKRQAKRILMLLELAKSPNETEALFLTGEEAKEQLQANKYCPGPIFTKDQQPLELQSIDGFLSEQYDDDAKVHIQDPSVKLAADLPHTREITIGKLKEHFQKDKVVVPFNCLELAAHVEDGLRPAFLNTEDCRLLTKLKHPSSEDTASRRGYTPGWKEVEKWALLAKAGALTEPHQDSHGYSTYITVNQGTIGFGWLANPNDAQRAAWRANPATFTEGEWRYVVLRPGQTVFFPAGTVHFVFRWSGAGDTLAFGGHVLRCSQIVRWVRALLEERETAGEVTNEDLSVSAPGYLARVEKFVRQARRTGQEAKWGGEEAIGEFLRLKAEFLGEVGRSGGAHV